ncbi:MAG: SLC13 family permease, partial [Shewanella sp.]
MGDLWLLAIVLFGLLAGLIAGRINPAVLFLFAFLLCYLLGMVTLDTALTSFTNTGLVTLVLLVLAATALEK